jgi:hypothetical protein
MRPAHSCGVGRVVKGVIKNTLEFLGVLRKMSVGHGIILLNQTKGSSMDFYDDYYETDMIRPDAKSCYCKLHSICTNCKESYN